MQVAERTLDIVFGKTRGECYYCGRSLIRTCYCEQGKGDAQGSWVVDYWTPRSQCASEAEHASAANLVAACVPCSIDKGEESGDEYLASMRQRGRAGRQAPPEG